jgi:protein tyrosine phosphatase
MITINEIQTNSQQKLWCESFLGFKYIAEKMEWDKYVDSNVAIISINNSSHCDITDEYHICKESHNVLNLDFDDIDPVALGLPENSISYTYENLYELGTYTTVVFFSREMAEKCVKFIEQNKDKHFFIHCSAGISRSQAFVKYIKNVYYDNEFYTNPDNPCLHPNGFVYQKLMQAYRTRDKITDKKKRDCSNNKKVFSKRK